MTKAENARYESADRGSIFQDEHQTELSALVLYPPLKVRYADIYNKITAARQKQFEQTVDITTDKDVLKDIMLKTVFKYELRASVQAFNMNEIELSVSLDKPISFISQGTDNDAIGRATDLKKIMSDNLTKLTQLDAADIDEMETAIKNFTLILNKPKSKIKTKKAEGTDPIPGLLNELEVIKKQIGKLILSYLPDLFHKWETEIKVGKPTGIRHTSLAVHYTEASTGVPLKKVKVTVTNGAQAIIKYSTEKGWIRLFSLDSDNYTVTAEHETFETSILTNVGVDDQHIARYEVKLEKKKPADDDIETKTGSFLITTVDTVTGNLVPDLQLTIESINRTFDSGDDAEFFGDALPPASYDALISGENIVTKAITITITANQQTELTISVELTDGD
jgi:hypothetical protein